MTWKGTNNKASLTHILTQVRLPYSHNRSSSDPWQEPIPLTTVTPVRIRRLSGSSLVHSFSFPPAGGGWSGEGPYERSPTGWTERDECGVRCESRDGCNEWCPIRPTRETMRERRHHLDHPPLPLAPVTSHSVSTLTSCRSSRFPSSFPSSDVGRLVSSIHLLGGTREPRWVSGTRRERTAYGTVFHPSFTSPFFPRSYVTRVTLTSFLGADWENEKNDDG